MPELPEVETTRRGIEPALRGRHFIGAKVRQPALRWPVPDNLARLIEQQPILAVKRRAKYLLLELPAGHVLIHLGMSGRLRVAPAGTPLRKHDHVDLLLDDGQLLRLQDPRRFGAVLWQAHPLEAHPLLAQLGPEPLGADFDGDWLYRRSRGMKSPVKNFIMDQKVVVGVGNIYASETLFLAGIHPQRPAGRISLARYQKLVRCIREVLQDALASGGTTLRDYVSPDGSPGYFSLSLRAYGRADQPCPRCGAPIRRRLIGQRASYYCADCQR